MMETSNRRPHGPASFQGEPAVDAVLRQAWYSENVDTIPDNARRLLEDYSGLKPEEVMPHVIALVNQSPRREYLIPPPYHQCLRSVVQLKQIRRGTKPSGSGLMRALVKCAS